MGEQNEKSTKSPGRDRWIKIGFVLVLIAVAVAIYSFQRRRLSIEGWGNDLGAALTQGKAERRMIVAFFVNNPPSEIARTIAKRRIPKPDNVKALKDGKFLTVVVSLDDGLDSDLARKYQLKALPTLMVLRPDGKERNRHEGGIGEANFRQNFLANTGKK